MQKKENAMEIISTFAHEFERYRLLMERAMENLSDEQFFARPGEQVNPVALILKKLSGNLKSRASDFLTTDGEKPTRDRDREFMLENGDTRDKLMEDWRLAWSTVDSTLRHLQDEDLSRRITIRGEPHTVLQALMRSVNHTTYHAGQILYLVRLFCPNAKWLTIAPGRAASTKVDT